MKKPFFFTFCFILFSNFEFTQSANLDKQEVKVLKVIWDKLGLLGRKEWNFDKDPCSDEGKPGHYVECDCSFKSNTTCRLIGIMIVSQNVSTALPSEFAKLQYLKNLDVSRNYLNGGMPSEWATMRLSSLSLMGNGLSGPFPIALTRITTLLYLNIEGNHFSGPIPYEIANLKNLEMLIVSSNDFTGQLPVALATLSNLKDVRISDNNFTGRIPNFISRWTQIQTLHIQGCSFEGPIPSSISVLTQLNDLRISDLKGGTSTFPPLGKMRQLSILVLRNCLIHGLIPIYVGFFISLQTLDLSFNNLTGEIPPSFAILRNARRIYLTKNDLTGPMPRWVRSSTSTKTVDLSFNNFTWDASGPKKCEQDRINDINPCLRKDFPCAKTIEQKIHSLYINCGGEEVLVNKTIKYDADVDTIGAPTYYNDGNWAFSSTGNFLDKEHDYGIYILSNMSNLHNISTTDTKLYTEARTAAISLTYYGLCLLNGNYTVRLHFAEIVFTQDNLFSSLGKRVFDVYVQGELKIKDFDIVKDAGGTGRAVIKSYNVNVKKNTLKIQLYWAGKGTTEIPFKGSYGPIISAISVDPNFMPPYKRKKLHVGVIVAIVGGVSLVLIITVILWRKGYTMTKNQSIELDQLTYTTSFN